MILAADEKQYDEWKVKMIEYMITGEPLIHSVLKKVETYEGVIVSRSNLHKKFNASKSME